MQPLTPIRPGTLPSSGLPSDANTLVGKRLKSDLPSPDLALRAPENFLFFLWTGGPERRRPARLIHKPSEPDVIYQP